MKRKHKCPALIKVMFPKDTNPAGKIFGGQILCEIDIAGAVAARRLCNNHIVTVAMDEVVFKKPVLVGDLLTCWAEVTRVGRTSVTVKVEVEAERDEGIIPVTQASVTYVAVDGEGRPTPVVLHTRARRCTSSGRQGSCGGSAKAQAPAPGRGGSARGRK